MTSFAPEMLLNILRQARQAGDSGSNWVAVYQPVLNAVTEPSLLPGARFLRPLDGVDPLVVTCVEGAIKTGERRVIGYVLTPIRRYRHKTARAR